MIANLNSERKELAKIIDFDQLFIKLEEAFRGLKDGSSIQPEQISLIAPNGDDCIIYSAADFKNEIVGVKLSPYIASRASRNLNPVSAYTVLLSMKTGEPIFICDSFNLTAMRTAATTILAISKLQPKLDKLAVIGFGAIGQEHLRFALKKFSWGSIHIYSPKIANDKKLGERQIMDNELSYSYSEIVFAKSLDEAIKDADVIMLCTSSKREVLDLKFTKESCIITSIVTNSPTAYEVKPESLIGCDIFCDYLPNSLTVAGEFKYMKQQNKIDELRIKGDLPDLCAPLSKGLVNQYGKRYFRSVGLGIEDIVIANALL